MKGLLEEPDALMWARPGLWEPWAGNHRGPPGNSTKPFASNAVATVVRPAMLQMRCMEITLIVPLWRPLTLIFNALLKSGRRCLGTLRRQ